MASRRDKGMMIKPTLRGKRGAAAASSEAGGPAMAIPTPKQPSKRLKSSDAAALAAALEQLLSKKASTCRMCDVTVKAHVIGHILSLFEVRMALCRFWHHA